jgi:hypothetical protein
MLDEHRTPRRYWMEAVNTACHVRNRIFLWAFLNKTCDKLMQGWAPKVSHFRAFGCRCFILKKGRLDKFESRSSDGIFLGYACHSRAFHVLNHDTNLVMQTSEVTFDETQPCNLSVFEWGPCVVRGPVDGPFLVWWVIDNVVWTDSWLSIAGAGCGLTRVGAGEV